MMTSSAVGNRYGSRLYYLRLPEGRGSVSHLRWLRDPGVIAFAATVPFTLIGALWLSLLLTAPASKAQSALSRPTMASSSAVAPRPATTVTLTAAAPRPTQARRNLAPPSRVLTLTQVVVEHVVTTSTPTSKTHDPKNDHGPSNDPSTTIPASD